MIRSLRCPYLSTLVGTGVGAGVGADVGQIAKLQEIDSPGLFSISFRTRRVILQTASQHAYFSANVFAFFLRRSETFLQDSAQ